MGPAALATLCGFSNPTADLASLLLAGERLSASERLECAELARTLVTSDRDEWATLAGRTSDDRAACWWAGSRHMGEIHEALGVARDEMVLAAEGARSNEAGRAWRQVLVGFSELVEVRRSCDVGDVRLWTAPGDLKLPADVSADVASVALNQWRVGLPE